MVRYIVEDGDNAQTFFEQTPKAYLALVVNNRINKAIPIHDTVDVGRDKTNTIVVSDQKVSRNHANVTVYDEATIVTDHGSANGTYVNNLYIKQPTRLQNEDKIRFGDTLFIFMTHEPELNKLIVDNSAFSDKPSEQITDNDRTSSSIISLSPNTQHLSTVWFALGCIAFIIVTLITVLAFLLGSLFASGGF
ncbi:FHA domain-containing protein [Anaerolineales bacterium HSG25]|nr:FHA domain-containing protein [Anaerolineales bacterium HSG25]